MGSASVIVAVALTVSCVVSPVVASSPVGISKAKNGRGLRLCPADGVSDSTFGPAAETVADHAVEDDLGPFRKRLVLGDDDADANLPRDVQLMRRNTVISIDRTHERNLDIGAPVVKPSRGDESTSAVAAGAGENRHFFAARIAHEEAVARELCELSAGILHHLEKIDAEIFNHGPVYFDHLVARHRGDRFPPVVNHDFERPLKSATTATMDQVPSSTMKGGNSMR